MPYKLSGACLVPTDDDTFYVMGGMTDENGAYEFLTHMLKYSVGRRLDHVQGVSIARSRGLVNSFCGSSSCNFLLDWLHSSCGMAH